MLFSYKDKKNKMRHHAWLYSAVFAGRFSTLLIFILFASFAIQPFHKAIASEPIEPEVEKAPPVADDVKFEETQPEPELVEEVANESSNEETVVDQVVSEEVVGTNDDTEEDSIADDEVEIEDVPAETLDSLDSEEQNVENKLPKEEQVVQVENLVTEENFYQFSKQSCVAVGEGTYHCSTSTESVADASSAVYIDRDNGGDMEVFLRTSKSKVKQITDNDYDDTAAHYDPESMKIVWQRLIDGRQQIVLFDILNGEEKQITFSKTNNMEPKVSAAGIVWQAWDNSDWEIMFFDGSYTEQLTDNSAQDVAPVIQDGYVLWNVLGGDDQQAQVYSLDTQETLSIDGYEGGVISNPRFVLVYDTKFDNGDVVTQSFDPSTGLSEPIAAQPAPEPINIPESDPVGEIRALISNKSKDEQLLLEVEADSNAAGTVPQTDNTLDLKSPGGEQDISVSAPSSANNQEFELTEYDLVIPESAYEEAIQQVSSSTQ